MTAKTTVTINNSKSPGKGRRSKADQTMAKQQQQASPKSASVPNKRVVVSRHDMDDDMQKEAVSLAHEALEKFKMEKDIACYIKKTFDNAHGNTWHCIVGQHFGSYITHETKCFVLFYIDDTAFQLYKTA